MPCANTRRKTGRALCLALLLLVPLHGQQDGNPDLDRIRGEITRLRKRLDQVRADKQTTRQAVEAAELEIGIKTRELEITLDQERQLVLQRAAIQDQIAELVPRIETQKEYLRKRLVALYRLGGLSYLRMFLSLGAHRDPSTSVSMLSFLISNDARTISRFQSARQELLMRNRELADRQVRLIETARLIEQQRREVAAMRREQARLLARLQREESGSELQIAELEEKARRLEQLVALLSKQPGAMIPDTDVRTFRGALAWPVEGKVIEQFGRQRNAKFATYTMNNGLKIAAPPRAEVRSVFQGTVLFSQWFKGYGNLMILDHGNRVFSLYGNLTGPAVTVGDRVTTGQIIAGVGEGEEAQSGYLYFEIREDNRPEDPQKWLR